VQTYLENGRSYRQEGDWGFRRAEQGTNVQGTIKKVNCQNSSEAVADDEDFVDSRTLCGKN
jgi:hypothetical protein